MSDEARPAKRSRQDWSSKDSEGDTAEHESDGDADDVDVARLMADEEYVFGGRFYLTCFRLCF
jgi:hypothetical protein